MKYSINNGKSWHESSSVLLSYEAIHEETDVELVVNATHEGIIIDVVSNEGVLGTSSEMAQEIVDRLIDD